MEERGEKRDEMMYGKGEKIRGGDDERSDKEV